MLSMRIARCAGLAAALILGGCAMEQPTSPAEPSTPQLSAMLAPCQQADTGCVDPMLIIDGKVTAYRDLDLRGIDVESIEVFKGATARAKYGEAARHGVVVITTKRAAGKL